MLRSSLYYYSNAYILICIQRTITVENKEAQGQQNNGANKKVIFKNCGPFTSCISRINNIEVDDAQYVDVGMPMYNLIKYSDNYSKTSGILWQYCRDEPALADDGAITDFTGGNVISSFNLKEKVTGQTEKDGTKNDEIMVPLK